MMMFNILLFVVVDYCLLLLIILLFIVVRGDCYYCGLFDEVDEDDDQYWVIRIDVVDEGH